MDMTVNYPVTVQHNIPLGTLSTFGIGGKAKIYCAVHSPDELIRVIRWAKQQKQPYKVFGGGSNTVFPDESIDYLVIQIEGGTQKLNKPRVTVDSGVTLADLVSESLSAGMSGLEYLSGIPGSVGGAIVGNAGAYGHSISEVVEKVEAFDGEKSVWFGNADCQFSYRDSIFKHKPLIVLRAVCRFVGGDSVELTETSQRIIRLREEKYKPGLKCPGSFFKNILVHDLDDEEMAVIDQTKIIAGKIPVGFLLEQVGAKGMRVGDIEVSDFHGNLIFNKGNGTAADVKELSALLKEKVRQKFGIELEEEVRYF